MADVTRGQTFGATEEVTNTKLHNLVDGATVTNIDKDDADSSNTSFTHIASTSPSSPYTGLLWLDTSTNILKRYDGSNFVPVNSGESVRFTNKSGAQVIAGDVVVVDTANDESFVTTTTANNQDVLGVALETISDDAAGGVAFAGLHDVNLVAAGTRGNFIQTSTTDQAAQQTTTQDGGTFGIVVESTGGAGLAKCVLFGGNNFSLTNDQIDAITGANAPSSSNVFITDNALADASTTRIELESSSSEWGQGITDTILATQTNGPTDTTHTISLSGNVPAGTKHVLCSSRISFTSVSGGANVLLSVFNVDTDGDGFDATPVPIYSQTANTSNPFWPATAADLTFKHSGGTTYVIDVWLPVDDNLDVKFRFNNGATGTYTQTMYLKAWHLE